MTYEDAKSYVNESIKEGHLDIDEVRTWTEEEFIAYAEENGARGDYLAEQAAESEFNNE